VGQRRDARVRAVGEEGGEVMATYLHPQRANVMVPAVTTGMFQTAVSTPETVSSDWRESLPVLRGKGFTLRQLRLSDAASLLSLLTTEEVTRFISPPPTTIEGFERFILWAERERQAGRYVCFAVVPDSYETAEWGFAIGAEFWGSGLFAGGASLVIDFTFDVIGAHRLEARAAVENGRGNGALRKIGAVQEGTLRKSFLRGGRHHDQALWSIVSEEWYRAKAVWGARLN
jgi:RimJ/RimL family protein N-acetyltransferase